MKKINEITKGKAKSMFTTDIEDHLIMHFSDDTSAFDGKKREALLCLLYTSPSPRDRTRSRMPSSA